MEYVPNQNKFVEQQTYKVARRTWKLRLRHSIKRGGHRI